MLHFLFRLGVFKELKPGEGLWIEIEATIKGFHAHFHIVRLLMLGVMPLLGNVCFKMQTTAGAGGRCNV